MVRFVLELSLAATWLVRKASLKGLHWKWKVTLLGLEKVIDLLSQSNLARYLVSQSIPKIMSNSFIVNTIKSAGRL